MKANVGHASRTAYSSIRGHVADPDLLRERAFVDGRWITAPSGATFEVRDPATSSLIALVASLPAAAAQDAIMAASRALPAWKALLPHQRATILRRWFDLIIAAREDLALIMTHEQGKPLAEARGEIDYAASFVEWYAEEGKRLNAESVTSHLPGTEMLVHREPLGVAALMTPWNFPAAMLTRKAAAALAAGCTVVAHPSAHAPLSALALAVLAQRAGIPAGVLNIVTGDAATIAGVFCRDPLVRVVSFTGSTEIGRLIAAQCAPTVKRVVMELGGHAPLIIFDDADVERAAGIALDAKFATSGQDCLAANRIFVQRALYPAFCEAFTKRVASLKMGAGLEPGIDIGPLMHHRAVAKVAAQVRDAMARGARRLVGADGDGSLFYPPTLLADVPDDATIMREETFGPVAAVTPFDSEAEVIARANDTEYGLVAYVVTKDSGRALRLSRALDFGMVAINRVKITGAAIPFGGVKQSGLGREGSRHGLEAFTDLKYTCLDLA
ncbi:NAD-dependent succinate-semialdehyde dehydrogenase [Kaistia algarum]|uniref:NAD-dependent succinate-semialdehyde dehydrogenase n=1 Tax=Kaistia algarum TaxID=2083279 RepID=UPI000CE7C1FF|nr:NAD-dependent succinate-semialdehyde dehydrogenase [Kaistia algarum]MCX5515824.1 NAD-dependent succinate-semialdehyde dehydrogenase [Kaistia algarum]PPE80804.1 NAD-dependent succinate-semialdehyde dehydrogenase [Kaistia algarum]